MTWDDESKTSGRRPYQVAELDLDFCQHRYGNSPCTATDGVENRVLESQDLSTPPWSDSFVIATSAGTAGFNDPYGDPARFAVVPTDEPSPISVRNRRLFQLGQSTIGIHATLSVWLQKRELLGGRISLNPNDGSAGGVLVCNLETGEYRAEVSRPGSRFGLFENSDGWMRFFIYTYANIASSFHVTINPMIDIDQDVNADWSPNGVDGIFMFDAQIRAGTVPGPNVKTQTTPIIGGAQDAAAACFNTLGTCQDTPNFLAEKKTYRFGSDRSQYPTAQIGELYPCIKRSRFGAARIDPGRGMGVRASVNVDLQDFNSNDSRGEDKYFESRYPSGTLPPGTYFGRFRGRNQYYQGRPFRLIEAYLDEAGNFLERMREFVVDRFTGPDARGRVSIQAKDVLDLAKNTKAQAPVPIDADVVLSVAINDVVTTLTFSSAATAQKLTTDGVTPIDPFVAIGEEHITLGAISGATWINCVRGANSETHDAGSTVQPCKTFTADHIDTVLEDLLQNFANVPLIFITKADWVLERQQHLPDYLVTNSIVKPTGVADLLKSLTGVTLSDLWYDELAQQIRWKVQSPWQNPVTTVYTDDAHFLIDSVRISDVPARRVTRVLTHFGLRDPMADRDKPKSYSSGYFLIRADKEGALQYDQRQLHELFNPWLPSTESTQAQLISTRTLDRYSDTPIEGTFALDAKDAELKTGDVFDMETRIHLDGAGNPKRVRMQVIEARPKDPGSTYDYKAFAFFEDPLTAGPLVISSNQVDFDLFVALGGPSQPVGTLENPQIVTIQAGVTMTATQGNPGFSFGELPPGCVIDITQLAAAAVRGTAGLGGRGGRGLYRAIFFPEPPANCATTGGGSNGSDGLIGGTAFDITGAGHIVTITYSGFVYAGGGGGGGGAGDADLDPVGGESNGGGGGGGGQGEDGVGSGAPGGPAVVDLQGCGFAFDNVGNPGTDGGPGGGQTGVGGGSVGSAAPSDPGGNGGAWGVAGFDSATSAGGAAGFAVKKHGNSVQIINGGGGDLRGQVGN